jgi:hypothetical protein
MNTVRKELQSILKELDELKLPNGCGTTGTI